jgi:hypothetical protein
VVTGDKPPQIDIRPFCDAHHPFDLIAQMTGAREATTIAMGRTSTDKA